MSRNVIRKHTRDRPRLSETHRAWDTVDQSLRELFDALDGATLSDEVLEREQTRDLVSATIANLPDHYRSALQSKYVEGESLQQLASRFDVSEEAAKSLLARSRRAFRETFLTLSREIEGALSTETV